MSIPNIVHPHPGPKTIDAISRLKQREMIKTTPPMLNNYYKDKVDRYFNLMLQ